MSSSHRPLISFVQLPCHNRNLQVLQNARSFMQTWSNFIAPSKSPGRASSTLCHHSMFLLIRELLLCYDFVCLSHPSNYVQQLTIWCLRLLPVWDGDQLALFGGLLNYIIRSVQQRTMYSTAVQKYIKGKVLKDQLFIAVLGRQLHRLGIFVPLHM